MQKKHLYYIAAIHLSNDISSGALPAILPFFVLYYGMDYTSMAGLMFASSFLASIIQPLFGYFADKTSKMWFMPFGVFATGTCLGITGFMQDYWSIFIAVTCMGIGSAIFHPEAASMVNHVAGKNKGSAMSIFSVGGNGGFGLGPILAVAMITAFGMKGLAVFAVIGVVMGLATLYYLPKIKASADRHIELQKEQEQEGHQESIQQNESVKYNDWGSFGKLTLVLGLRSVVFTGISSFLPIYCIQVLGAPNGWATTTLSILSISGILMTLIGGYASDRWGYVNVLRIGLTILLPVLAMAIYGGNIWWVYAMLLPISFAIYSTYSPVVVLGQTYLAKNIGFASGITLGLSFSVGGVVVPFMGNYADDKGLPAVMVVLLIVAMLGAVATFLLPQESKRMKKLQ